MLILFLAQLAAPSRVSGAEAKTLSKARSAGSDDLFYQPRVLQLKVEIPAASLQALKEDPKTYVKGTIREGEKIYAGVGFRLKGNAPFESQEKKPSLAVKFNQFAAGLQFHGHTRMILDNAHQDPTCLSEALGSAMFRAAGVPAAKVTFAQVELNGRDVGLYVVEQAVNREFLAENFKKAKGNLYEGAHLDIADELKKDSGDMGEEQTDLKKLAEAAREPDPSERFKKLAAVLDLEAFISFAAMEVLVWHHGGYTMAQNNYRIYHDPATDQLVFIPHSLDQLFIKPTAPLVPEWKSLLAKAIFETPEGQRRYRERMAALLGNSCKVDMLHARLNALADRVRPSMARTPAEGKAFEAALVFFRERIAQRIHMLEEELKKPMS